MGAPYLDSEMWAFAQRANRPPEVIAIAYRDRYFADLQIAEVLLGKKIQKELRCPGGVYRYRPV
jgi:hypothetical protein